MIVNLNNIKIKKKMKKENVLKNKKKEKVS